MKVFYLEYHRLTYCYFSENLAVESVYSVCKSIHNRFEFNMWSTYAFALLLNLVVDPVDLRLVSLVDVQDLRYSKSRICLTQLL